MEVPTVRIKTDWGEVDINESDYDPKVHQLAGGKPAAKKSAAKKKAAKRG